jgi:tetratricopeptide (TPR) repeat protein
MRRGTPALFALLAAAALAGGCAAKKTLTLPLRTDQDLHEAASLAQQAERALAAGRFEESVELGRQSVDRYPSLSGAWNNLGVAFMRLGRNQEAVTAFRRAADLLPTDPKPYENMGLIYLQTGWAEQALQYYELSLERDPNYLPSLRGAMVSAKHLLRSSDAILERARRGLLIETDPEWRKVFEAEQMRVAGELAERNKGLRTPS